MAKKLTAVQVEILRQVAANGVYRSESIGTLYDSFRRDNHRNISRQIDTLVAAGLIQIGAHEGWERRWDLTDAGTKLLAALDASDPTPTT